MLWEVEIRPLGNDAERERVCDEFDLLTNSKRGMELVKASAKGYLLAGELTDDAVALLCNQLFVDPLVERGKISQVPANATESYSTVLLKPGVMDPTSESVLKAAHDLGIGVSAVRTFRRYFGPATIDEADKTMLFRKVLANDAIEQIVSGPLSIDVVGQAKPYAFHLVSVPILGLNDAELVQLSKTGMLALSLEEMRTIQSHYAELRRDPTDIELETIAQTWSEHCSHKTLKGAILYTETRGQQTTTKHYKNLLKETVFGATQSIRATLGADDWCVSVFADNAGVVTFDDEIHVCIKVETHNHPSAIEPYGGANTGLGGVIRDPLGTGLGAKPICNTDVFCFASPDYPTGSLPKGVLHPRRVMRGVVSGVRDYGNRMGIPTVNGAIQFDDRYLANPLVFCGTIGTIPVDKAFKQTQPGDLIVALGGRTGRDGIHGATFSSLELTDESETLSGGAVQIGNAIAEKKVLDVVLAARDRNLFTAITDCGAGGFSSAVGEMGAELGAEVHLENAPLKYDGLSYTEIWISESQERMVLSVCPEKWPELLALCESEDVEAAVLGTFVPTGKLALYFRGQHVGELSMQVLHDGRPDITRLAEWIEPPVVPQAMLSRSLSPQDALLKILGTFTVCSKEWVIRQYDHEVQGGSVIKPLVGAHNDGPSDAAVVMPTLGKLRGITVGCGLNPLYGDIDPYAMAAAAIDEALRNVICVGADPSRTAILDNFCWGNVHDPLILGALVRTAEACRDVAIAFQTPFVSGKDSLNNTFADAAGNRISIPHTLLITALGQVPDVTKCVTMDFKRAGNLIYQIGHTHEELGGSHYHVVQGQKGGVVPKVDLVLAPKIFQAVHAAILAGTIRSCHDLSEGGLAVAVAEMAFAGNIGAELTELRLLPGSDDVVKLFSESQSRFLVEIEPEHQPEFERHFVGLPICKLGVTVSEPRLRVAGSNGEWIIWAKLSEIKEVWQKPLRW